MFVFDQTAVNYSVFEEANSNPRTFYGMNREFVFDQLMTVEALMDDAKGYIVNDSCIFGVEIAVPRFAIRGESLLLTKDPENNISTWRIPSLNDAGKENFSDEFEIGGHNWMLSMYPRGDQKAKKNYLSLFLCLANTQSLPLGRKVYVEYKLRIKNRLGFKDYEKAGFVTSTREAPPAHYSLKVEPFSLFLDSKNDKFESGVFEGAGNKWKLCFYPNRQLRNGGAKYISLGLEIADADLLPFGWQVIVHCKMFVFDQTAVNYTVFEEANSNPRTFYGMNREFVFDQLMTVEALMDDTKGYIVNDSCIFGVEIAVPRFAIRGECLLLTKDPENNIFPWRIPSLNDAGKENFSDEFEIGGHNWMLSMYPRGDQKAKKNYLSLFLCLANTQSLPLGRKVYVEYKLRIKNRLGFNDYEKAGHECVYTKVTKLGFSDFIQLGEVYDESKGFLFNGSMIIEGEITVMSSFNYLE